MELDDFKHVWQASQAATTDPPLDAARIRELLRRRSTSAVAQLRRNMGLEVGATAVLLAILGGFVWRQPDPRMQTVFWLTLAFCIVYAGAMLHFFNRLGTPPNPALPMVAQLRRTVALTEHYLDTYQRSLTWLTLGGMALGAAFGFLLQSHEPVVQTVSTTPLWLRFGVVAGGGLVLMAVFYWLTKWFYRYWLKTLYGRHLDELRACLTELEEA